MGSVREQYENEPTDFPDVKSVGEAWKIETDTPHPANCGAYLVKTPGYGHPLWWYYQVHCIHLRDVPGEEPAKIRMKGATHEIMFIALNPKDALPPIKGWGNASWLFPIDIEHQFAVRNDQQAKKLLNSVVKHICEGHSPDQGYREYWSQVIDNTAEHLAFGGHPSDN